MELKKRGQLLLAFFAFKLLLSLAAPLLPNTPQAFSGWCTAQAQDSPDHDWWQRFVSMFQKVELPEAPAIPEIFAPQDSTESESPKDLTEKYSEIYQFINGVKKSDYDSLLAAGLLFQDTLEGLVYRKYEAMGSKIDTNYQVYGWHPYWMGMAYKSYNFSLLSTISYFSYDLDPATGAYQNPNVIADWKQTEMVKMAHASGCKVQLTVSCHQSQDIRDFLNNETNQQSNLTDSLILLLAAQEADGINLNFEMVPKNYGASFSRFVQRLSNQLKAVKPDYSLTLTLPKIDDYNFFQIEQLHQYVDQFILMGYDYHYSGGQPGPISPLRGGQKNIVNSVSFYEQQGFSGKIKKKLLLGLPYYGSQWKHDKTKTEFVQSLTYRAIKDQFTKQEIRYDTLSGSAYTLVKYKDNNYRECWFEDSTSLAAKYNWAKDQQLGGIGIWALGYDNGYNELWGLIDQEFAADSIGLYGTIAAASLATEGFVFNLAEAMSKYHIIIITAALFLIVFIIIGFITGIFNSDVRAIFFANYTYRLIYVIGVFILVVSAYIIHRLLGGEYFLDHIMLILSAALLFGSLLTFAISKWYAAHREKLP